MNAPIKTIRVDVSAIDPGIEPINISIILYCSGEFPAASIPRIVSPETPSTFEASDTQT